MKRSFDRLIGASYLPQYSYEYENDEHVVKKSKNSLFYHPIALTEICFVNMAPQASADLIKRAEIKLDGTLVQNGVCTVCQFVFGTTVSHNLHNVHNFRIHFMSYHAAHWNSHVANVSASLSAPEGALLPSSADRLTRSLLPSNPHVTAHSVDVNESIVVKGRCLICRVPVQRIDIKSHVAGAKHRSNVALVAPSAPSTHQQTQNAVNHSAFVNGQCMVCKVNPGGSEHNRREHINGANHRAQVALMRANPPTAAVAQVAIASGGDQYIINGFCSLCGSNPGGGGQHNIRQHVASAGHRIKVAAARSTAAPQSISVPTGSTRSNQHTTSKLTRFDHIDSNGFCQLCRADCGAYNGHNMRGHVNGIKHQSKVRQFMARNASRSLTQHFSSTVWRDNTCQLCNVFVPSAESQRQHELGKRHNQRLSKPSRAWIAPGLIHQLNTTSSSQGITIKFVCNGAPVVNGNCTILSGTLSTLQVQVRNDGSSTLSAEWRIAPALPFKSFNMPSDRTLSLQVGNNSFSLPLCPAANELGKVSLMLSLMIQGGMSIIAYLVIAVHSHNSDLDRKLIAKTSEYRPVKRKKAVSIYAAPALTGERRKRASIPTINRLVDYKLPDSISMLISDSNKLTQEMHVLLSASNHHERFRTLLFLEEYELHLNIQAFDMSDANLTKSSHSGLFALEVPGLAEDRPSVMVGDTVRLSLSSHDTRNGIVFGGSVHYVDQTHVHLRFHDSFLKGWNPLTKWFVRFEFGRVPLLRCHQALEISTHNNVIPRLFPTMPLHVTATSNSAECDQWIDSNIVDQDVKMVGVALETLTHSSRLGLIQVATHEACLIFYLGNKNGRASLPAQLISLIENVDITKCVSGGAGEDLLDQQFGPLHFISGHDVEAELMQSLKQTTHWQLVSDPDEHVFEMPVWDWPLKRSLLDLATAGAYVPLQIHLELKTSPNRNRLLRLTDVLKQRQMTPSLSYRPVIDNPPIRLYNQNLNLEQRAAVTSIVTGAHHPAPFILDGTPGSGKTSTIVETLRQLIIPTVPDIVKKQAQHIRILVCAPSNSAADLIVSKMSPYLTPSQMYRLNAASRAQASIAPHLLMYSSFVDGEVRQKPLPELLQYKLIVSTCMASATLYAYGCQTNQFSHIFIDEAGQCTEPETLVALTGLIDGENGHVILGGDPQQLGPVLQSKLSEKQLGVFNLSLSLLERLYRTSLTDIRSPYHPSNNVNHRFMVRLVENYRSHPAIVAQPSEMFYNSSLVACAEVARRESLQDWEGFPSRNFPILFHHLASTEDREGSSPSWFNEDEALQVVAYIEQLLAYRKGNLQPFEIGVISPYRQQCKRIRKLVERRKIDTKALKIGSVEEFQGQERRLIIISTVRSQLSSFEFDQKYSLGFVSHPKRLNVAITRAESALIIVGNSQVLCTDPLWRKFANYCVQNEAMVGATARSSWYGVDKEAVELISDLGAHIGVSNEQNSPVECIDVKTVQGDANLPSDDEASDDENSDVDEMARDQ